MKRNHLKALCFAVLPFLVCCMTGCGTSSYRVYPGPPLPSNEVAIVWCVTYCGIDYLHNEKEEKLLSNYSPDHTVYDLLPGQYIAGVTLRAPDFYGRIVQLRLNVQGGNIYVIYPEIAGTQSELKWSPIAENINKYNESHFDQNKIINLNRPDQDQIRKWTAEYLQSERRTIKYCPLKKPYEQLYYEDIRKVYNGYWQGDDY